jgi:hypothetical protein
MLTFFLTKQMLYKLKHVNATWYTGECQGQEELILLVCTANILGFESDIHI